MQYAYRHQLRCDPHNAFHYLEAMKVISEVPRIADAEQLAFAVLTEKSKGYFTEEDLAKALTRLGFGEEGPLRIAFDTDIDGEFLMNAFATAWSDINHMYGGDGPNNDQKDVALKDLKESVEIAAMSTGRVELVKYVEEALRKRNRDPVLAYSALGASEGMDEDLILAIYSMRVSSQTLYRKRSPLKHTFVHLRLLTNPGILRSGWRLLTLLPTSEVALASKPSCRLGRIVSAYRIDWHCNVALS